MPVAFRISLSKNESVEYAQHVPERFWSLTLVMGISLIVVNTGLFLFSSLSCAIAPVASNATTASIKIFFIVFCFLLYCL